jgi:hypothetical protein
MPNDNDDARRLDTYHEALLLDALNRGCCPDCNRRGFVLGPKGGAAQNIECANLECRSRFNVTSGMTMELIFAQRIPSEAEGGSLWINTPPNASS